MAFGDEAASVLVAVLFQGMCTQQWSGIGHAVRVCIGEKSSSQVPAWHCMATCKYSAVGPRKKASRCEEPALAGWLAVRQGA